jgi:hypothetical protein
MFGRQWVSAQGTIVATRLVSVSGDGTVSTTEFVADVRTAEGETFRAKVGEPRIVNDFKAPIVGAVVRVEFDAKSRKVRFDKSDPALSWKAYEKDRKTAFDDTIAQTPGSEPAPVAAQLPNMQALIQAANGAVVRLDSDSPEAAALREMLLRAAEQTGTRPIADPPDRDSESS